MNAINKAISDVGFSIPPEILQYAFISNSKSFRRVAISVDSRIREEVVSKRVLQDCSLEGGVHFPVNLSKIRPSVSDPGYRVYNIPKSATQGRQLMSTICVGNSSYINNRFRDGMLEPQSMGLIGGANAILNSAGSMEVMQSTEVRLVGENMVLVEADLLPYRNDVWLHAVGSNIDMSELPPKAYSSFSELVVLATKAWIYNNTRVKLDRGAIVGGVELGSFRDTIESYADANELYLEALRTKWSKIALMSDKTSRKHHVRLITPRM